MKYYNEKGFLSLEMLKQRVWDTRDEAVKDLKKSGFAEATNAYRLSQTTTGRWYIEEIPADTSQEAPAATAKTPPKKAAGTKKAAAAGLKLILPDETRMEPAWEPTAPAAAKSPEAKSPPAKAAAKPSPPAKRAAPAKKPAATSSKKNKSSPASSDEVPEGFDDWAIEQATGTDGVMRTALNAKLGVERRWMPYLQELAKKRGYSVTMQRDGRFTRFRMKKL